MQHISSVSPLVRHLSAEARRAPESGIVEVINAGRERDDLVPLWVGEGDLPTPDFICQAAKQSFDRGETFYTYQRGIPELRQALAEDHSKLYGKPFSAERFFVTGSGMQSIQIAVRCVAGPGDEVVYAAPAWPNLPAAVELTGAHAVPVAMELHDGRWELDVERLFAAVTPKTRAIFLNSPCNPTGWVAGREVLQAVLTETRKRGLWIIADEVYGRFFYGAGTAAPSFYDVAEEDDMILYVNTFSKNWAMTGWRAGWISAPRALGQVIENLIQYSTSGVPVPTQRAAIAALTQGADFLADQISRAAAGREAIVSTLSQVPRLQLSEADGAFYLFFSIDGVRDSRQGALDLVRETGVGLAPGVAFGAAGEGYFRLCYASSLKRLETAGNRIGDWAAQYKVAG
ncbi:pyridoxal phosphate-dependent aminotransferase [Roseibium sp. CAU 1637]|uniref:aspartate transaminase n=1 Tax=Roseibium limicola TaxID=2816037 RepID=A0A939J8K6_9HYPH|nr:pyridoxal phosphate-dependent aminotransferase [Roseibium limicola]MBO0345411.1 pyridoxal phosphate-dependent aminotransferase [Roseibium limicola]